MHDFFMLISILLGIAAFVLTVKVHFLFVLVFFIAVYWYSKELDIVSTQMALEDIDPEDKEDFLKFLKTIK